MSERYRLLSSVVTVTGVLGILLGVRPLPAERLLAAYVLALAAIVLLHFVRAYRGEIAPAPSRLERALRERTRATGGRPAVFLAMERELELGIAHAGHAHRRLLPLLRAAAAARLQSRHGIELGRGSPAARKLLGDEAWDFLRPDRPPPADPFGPGVPRETVATLIERVEAL
ncbi:MAG: hypothetical protein ACRDLM_04795 [Gaiellaceae bacterium]